MTSPLDLLGRWHLERVVDDRLGGVELQVSGTTELVADGPGRVSWREEGRLRRPGHDPVDVQRALVVEQRDDGWWVLFDHGGPFHPWRPGTWVTHPCAADTYRGLVQADGPTPTSWRVTWQVTGPAKDHTITSTLTR